jgi:hypothetical protein
MKVELKDVIEAIEFENESLNHFYNKKTGIIIYKEDFETTSYKAEDINRLNELEEWEKELVNNLHDLNEHPEDYIQLPVKDESYELNMMMEFCNSFNDINMTDKTLNEEELKKIIQDKNLLSEWYDYREYVEKEIAIEWCKENNIEYNSCRDR